MPRPVRLSNEAELRVIQRNMAHAKGEKTPKKGKGKMHEIVNEVIKLREENAELSMRLARAEEAQKILWRFFEPQWVIARNLHPDQHYMNISIALIVRTAERLQALQQTQSTQQDSFMGIPVKLDSTVEPGVYVLASEHEAITVELQQTQEGE